ncbi:hypothetical protein Bca4012_084048 [Brassica carinata]
MVPGWELIVDISFLRERQLSGEIRLFQILRIWFRRLEIITSTEPRVQRNVSSLFGNVLQQKTTSQISVTSLSWWNKVRKLKRHPRADTRCDIGA